MPLSAQDPQSSSQTQNKTAQSPPPSSTAPEEKKSAEVETRDTPATFKVRVNLVLARVVVRDQLGKVVENLHREDFALTDDRKPQVISFFSVETPTSRLVPVTTASSNGMEEAAGAPVATTAAMPQRFVSILYDDVHIEMADAVGVRVATTKLLDSLSPSDRVGIFTTSGQKTQDFTSDRELLRQALLGIVPRSMAGRQSSGNNCPDISYYQADLIVNRSDDQALNAAVIDTVDCMFSGDQTKIQVARPIAEAAAQTTLSQGDADTEYAYRHMEDTMRRLSGMPGQRILVFVSPGFIMSKLFSQAYGIIDRATRAGIVIDTIDARGLYTPDVMGDVSERPGGSFRVQGLKLLYRTSAQSAQSQILDDFAASTGGTYFHNRNDLDEAFKQAVAAPPVSYVLGFSPQNLKLNGAYHTLKVTMVGKQKYTLQARKGYFAPSKAQDPVETAKQEIQEAIFSQDEIHDLPVDLQTQFFKTDPSQAKLSVIAHLDLKSVKFRKAEGRNRDDVTLATAIFDENGNFITGGEKIVEMRLLDGTLDRLGQKGINVKSSFDVKPGSYFVRLVVRDAEGEQMAARNGAVVIPY
ncbi:MAG TPA: VWA domain-containing protein [Candidatus Eremiobacteraceae bacterium]|nr:VWA domain-containing protein [Candidatus Eremiobacteraceae bacterium]